MAILKIAKDIIITEPDLFKFICDQFTSMEEMTSDHEGEKKYSVQKEGIPNDNTEVKMVIKKANNNTLKVIWFDE